MAIRLDVPVFGQRSPMSCWWASMRMVLTYYGRQAPAIPQFPEERLPFRPLDPFETAPPSLWYATGLPQGGIGRLTELTSFRTLPEIPSAWTQRNLERTLRAYGPIILYGSWNGAPHAFVITGAEASRCYANDPGEDPADPDAANGFLREETYVWINAFSARMGGARSNWFLPPLYLPNDPPPRAARP